LVGMTVLLKAPVLVLRLVDSLVALTDAKLEVNKVALLAELMVFESVV